MYFKINVLMAPELALSCVFFYKEVNYMFMSSSPRNQLIKK